MISGSNWHSFSGRLSLSRHLHSLHASLELPPGPTASASDEFVGSRRPLAQAMQQPRERRRTLMYVEQGSCKQGRSIVLASPPGAEQYRLGRFPAVDPSAAETPAIAGIAEAAVGAGGPTGLERKHAPSCTVPIAGVRLLVFVRSIGDNGDDQHCRFARARQQCCERD